MNKKVDNEAENGEVIEETKSTDGDYSWRHWRGERRHYGGSSNGALILILIGIIFLLNNFGLLSSDIWGILWRFWPVFLVYAGLQMILGRSQAGKAIVTVLGFLIALTIFAISLAQVNPAFSMWIHTQLPILNHLPNSY